MNTPCRSGRWSWVLTAILGCGTAPISAALQTPMGSVTVIVLDPSGASVPHARVTVTAETTSPDPAVAREFPVTPGGRAVVAIESGEYRIRVRADGFQTVQLPLVRVRAGRDTMRRVGEAIEKLKPQTGSIFVMHRFDGMSYEEIAKAKGISVKGVEWHIAQAMIAIRKARAGTK